MSAVVTQGSSIRLDAHFFNDKNVLVDPTNLSLTIVSPGNIAVKNALVVGTTGDVITQQEIGKFYYDYNVPANASVGAYVATWTGLIDGDNFDKDDIFSIVASGTSLANTNIIFENIRKEKWGELLRVYLKDIDERNYAFAPLEISLFLDGALSDFNAWPHFTDFGWDSVPETWMSPITQGAQAFALIAQGIIEAGREFTITENGINFNPPQISAHIQSAYGTLLSTYMENKKAIKENFKPNPAMLGTYRVLAVNPYLIRLRHLREKRIV